MSWAQQEDEPPIEQVGEERTDVETLDEAATNEDVETLDEAAPPPVEVDTTEDIELLDQGPPSTMEAGRRTPGPRPPPATAAEAPAAIDTEARCPRNHLCGSGRHELDPLFRKGSDRQRPCCHGSAGFPVGLEDCHVGAVTGRAYVGVDCGDSDGSMFVGHAPSFEDFPFVLDENFPFDRGSVFAGPGTGQSMTIFRRRSRPPAAHHATTTRPHRRSGHPVRHRWNSSSERRDEILASNRKTIARSVEMNLAGAETAMSPHPNRRSGVIGRRPIHHQKKKHGNDNNRSGSAKDNGKKSKSSKHAKNRGGKKGKKSQSSK